MYISNALSLVVSLSLAKRDRGPQMGPGSRLTGNGIRTQLGAMGPSPRARAQWSKNASGPEPNGLKGPRTQAQWAKWTQDPSPMGQRSPGPGPIGPNGPRFKTMICNILVIWYADGTRMVL